MSRFPDVTTTATLNVTLSSTPGVSFMEAVKASNVLKNFKFIKSNLPETETPAETETTAARESEKDDATIPVRPGETDTFSFVQPVDTETATVTEALTTTTTTAARESEKDDATIPVRPGETDTFSSVQPVDTELGEVR